VTTMNMLISIGRSDTETNTQPHPLLGPGTLGVSLENPGLYTWRTGVQQVEMLPVSAE
jgi:hypothetical protein